MALRAALGMRGATEAGARGERVEGVREEAMGQRAFSMVVCTRTGRVAKRASVVRVRGRGIARSRSTN